MNSFTRIVAAVTALVVATATFGQRPQDDRLATELLAILEKTKSSDAFLVTLAQLKECGTDAKRVIPVAIRNAERLGIFDDHLFRPDDTKGEIAKEVAEMLGEMRKPAREADPRASDPLLRSSTHKIEPKSECPKDIRNPLPSPVGECAPTQACDDPPTDREVLRAMPAKMREIASRSGDAKIVKKRLVDRIDPPRFFPLVGIARLHHRHWECTVHFVEKVTADDPFPAQFDKQRTEVIYIDKDVLRIAAPDEERPVSIP